MEADTQCVCAVYVLHLKKCRHGFLELAIVHTVGGFVHVGQKVICSHLPHQSQRLSQSAQYACSKQQWSQTLYHVVVASINVVENLFYI